MESQFLLHLTAPTDLQGEVREGQGNKLHRLSYRGRALQSKVTADQGAKTMFHIYSNLLSTFKLLPQSCKYMTFS